MRMDRFACNGYLHVTADERDTGTVRVTITHHLPHLPYCDISIPKSIEDEIEQLKDLPASKVRAFMSMITRTECSAIDLDEDTQETFRYQCDTEADLCTLV
jgi:hypothetical protein